MTSVYPPPQLLGCTGNGKLVRVKKENHFAKLLKKPIQKKQIGGPGTLDSPIWDTGWPILHLKPTLEGHLV